MDVVRIFNGLGNQMSQYAFYYAKKKVSPHRTCMLTNQADKNAAHNGYELGRLFGITSCAAKERILQYVLDAQHHPVTGYRLLGHLSRTIEERSDYGFDAALLKPSAQPGFTYYFGGWHSEKYFRHLRAELLDIFHFNEQMLSSDTKMWTDRIRQDEGSCSLHIRRGDFLKDAKWADAITPDYYSNAIHKIRQLQPSVHFYVFSNDTEWCREHLGEQDFSYVDCNSGEDSWQDMYLMTQCRHHINANSSFSWWGAWLSAHDDGAVIVPRKFISTHDAKDVYPDNWMKL